MKQQQQNHNRIRSPFHHQEVLYHLREGSKALSRLIQVLEEQGAIHELSDNRLPMKMTRQVYEQIYRTVGQRPAEQGGILAGSNGTVTMFYFDQDARRTRATYSPNREVLNRLLQEEWNPRRIRLLGFVHSHPPNVRMPSDGDVIYAQRILEHNSHLDRLLLPIVMTQPDTGRFELLPFAAVRRGSSIEIQALELELVDEVGYPTFSREETFCRVQKAYDLERLAKARVIYVGVGGAASFVEELARAGVKQHILIDPDVVSESNLATQQVYRKDLGRPKVEVLAERLWDINPDAVVVTIQKSLEEIDDGDFRRLVVTRFGGQASEITLLCGLTDSFDAQARVNRLALQFGLPSLCAQVYWEGRGAEITFTYPGVTPACHRCALSRRYQAYLQEGYRNTVTSDGTPIFATTRLNALKGFIALAILHHGTDHPRWGRMLERIGSRNLIQIRMDPDLAQTLGLRVFDRVFLGEEVTENAAWRYERVFFDEAVWLPQDPEPECPDCGGTGDLRTAIGRFADTRPMIREASHAPVLVRQ